MKYLSHLRNLNLAKFFTPDIFLMTLDCDNDNECRQKGN